MVFADGSITTSSSMGVMVLSERLSLKYVLYVSDLNFSLISVSKLLKNINCFSLFTDAICVLHDRFTKPMTRASEECDWVYYFKDVKVARVKKMMGISIKICAILGKDIRPFLCFLLRLCILVF